MPDVFRGGIERDQCYEMIKSKLISQALKQMLNLSMCYVILLTFFYYIHLSCIDMCAFLLISFRNSDISRNLLVMSAYFWNNWAKMFPAKILLIEKIETAEVVNKDVAKNH